MLVTSVLSGDTGNRGESLGLFGGQPSSRFSKRHFFERSKVEKEVRTSNILLWLP